MNHVGIRLVGLIAAAALTFQFAAGASDSPCATMDHSAGTGANGADGAMAGMPMPNAETPAHSGEHCSERQDVPECQAAAACAVLAMPSVTAFFRAVHVVALTPVSAPVTLLSAHTTPDRPPPRA